MSKKQTKKYAQVVILGLAILILVLSIVFTRPISDTIKQALYKADIKVSSQDMVVHYINVGQGDAIAISFPDDKVMLIDSGPKDSQNILLKYLKTEVMKSSNNSTIDYVILTHPDIDHSGGMSCVFAEFSVKKFFRPNIASKSEDDEFEIKSTSEEYDEVIKLSQNEDGLITKVVREEITFTIGEALIEILPPIKQYSTTNAMSCLTKITYHGKSFLFTGDIQEESEQDMLDYYGERLNADVLKVAHHGSKTSTGKQFVDAVTPEYAVICVGPNNYGHPHFTTISTLENAGVEVLTTLTEDVRFVCGPEMFGVLEPETTHSFEFINWWIIALFLIILLLYKLIKLIVLLVKENANQCAKDLK